jgi:outer membrane lipopolysaccharide assembly protein LptE/RlpB
VSFRLKSTSGIRKKGLKRQKDPIKKALVGSILLVLSIVLVAGCGYHVRKGGKPLGLKIQSIAIPLVKSPASTLGFEGDFTRVIRQEFISHSSLELVPRDRADAILLTNVTRINTESIGYDITRNTIQNHTIDYAVTNRRRMWVRVDARLIDGKSGAVIWEEKGIREQADFAVSEDPLVTRYNRKLAVESIALNVANRLFAMTMERF